MYDIKNRLTKIDMKKQLDKNGSKMESVMLDMILTVC